MPNPTLAGLITEEQSAEAPADDWGGTRRLRWHLLHGHAYTAEEAAETFGLSLTALSVMSLDLQNAGFHLVKERVEGTQRHRKRVTNLHHPPARAVTTRSNNQQTARRRARAQVPAVIDETPTEAHRRHNATYSARRAADKAELEQLRHFHRDAPTTPPLGTVVRVSMVAEDNGSAVLVLSDLGGFRWFCRVEGADVEEPKR